MTLRTSKSPLQTRSARPGLLKLEDRIVPGEMFGTSMFWAMGAFADPAALLPAYSADDRAQSGVERPAVSREADTAALPFVDTSTLSICRSYNADSSSSAETPAATDDTPAASAATGTSDGVFAGLSDDANFDLSATSAPMGDLLHPGASAPMVPNAAVGATGSVPFLAPSFSVPFAGGGGVSQNAGATLASLANVFAGAATAGSASSGAAVAGAAVSGGGVMSPLFHAHAVSAPDKAHPDAANGAPPFSPAQIQQAYGINLLSQTGAGQTIYIVDAFNDPNIASDLATFDAQWGLPAPPSFTVHKMSNRVRNNSSWGFEESLDVEWAHAIAPQANIVLVEATTNSNTNLYAAVDWATNNGAHIVSMSFGGGDSASDGSLDAHFNHAGVTYLASSGDTGAAVEYPAASPYVLAVGGTSLTLTTSNAYSSETAWSSGGGGVTTNEARPGYQTSYGITSSGRSIPDVSFDADPNTGVYVYDSFVAGGGGWYEVGGTSLSAPAWAGLIALADQGRATPLSTNSLTSRIEYTAASGTDYANNYHDITTGSNGHAAGTGYDLATGVGSPQANNLIPWLISH